MSVCVCLYGCVWVFVCVCVCVCVRALEFQTIEPILMKFRTFEDHEPVGIVFVYI